ncbi:cyclic nucleotide-binding domain-containing protein 2 [Eublepharis macularius]|uniref:Cyclic nucleotide-binding domain-containing protein 2 n=1 Tax=Eublepharis macularius TaxID=481883 RepID=A0AA97IV51_EUBMA|nr:cyclic nucleotide-binding domain-containing protein 2 [Eublepharis macularius]
MSKTLQKLVWQIMLRIRACRSFQDGLKGFTGFHLIDNRSEMDEDKKYYNVAFNCHEFSVSKDHFPFKAIQITKKIPEWRGEDEIRYLRNRLLTLESFHAYSPTVQYLLAQVIRFERFGRRRVIIKKGHHGSSFYFIFAGVVAITDDEDGGSAFVDTAPAVLRKGASFGEVALLKGAKRIATVVCMEDTELLVVDKKDFFAYKLDEELHREFLIRYNYLRKVDIFETLSNSSIEKIANFCRIERFHFGQVITSNIGESSNITFITKGACDVLREIDLSSCPSYHKWLTKQLLSPKSHPQIKEKKHLDYVSDIACVDRFKSYRWNSFSGHELSQLKARYGSQPSRQGLGNQSSVLSRHHKSVVLKVDTADPKSLFFGQQDDNREVVQNVISGDLQKKSVYCTPYGEIPASTAAAVYIRVDELHKGDYLVNLQDIRPMILVSKGVNLMRLKKDKLEECADDATIMRLCKIKIKYPSDDELCQVFLRQNSWELFKKDLLKFVMKPKLMKMVTPPDSYPAEEIAESWYMNEKGILDLTPIQCHRNLPPETCKYVPCHPKCAKDDEFLPQIQPKLIHGINVIRPTLEGVF